MSQKVAGKMLETWKRPKRVIRPAMLTPFGADRLLILPPEGLRFTPNRFAGRASGVGTGMAACGRTNDVTSRSFMFGRSAALRHNISRAVARTPIPKAAFR